MHVSRAHRDAWRHQGWESGKSVIFDHPDKCPRCSNSSKYPRVRDKCLAWMLAQGDNVIPLPGPDRIDQLEADVGEAGAVLDGPALAALDALPPPAS